MNGKPYSRKPNVRFDEEELKIGLLLLCQFSTLPIPAAINSIKKGIDTKT